MNNNQHILEGAKREAWLDCFKSIGIILIVWGHAMLPIYISGYFFVPIFFFASGYVYKTRDLKSLVIKLVKSLYIPFVIGNVIAIILHQVLYIFGVYNTSYSLSSLIKSLFKIMLFDCVDTLAAPTWFIPALFLMQIAFTLLLYFVKKVFKDEKFVFIGILIMLFIGMFFRNSLNKFIWGNSAILMQLFVCSTFFYIGWISKQYKKMFYVPKSNIYKIAILSSCILLLFVSNRYFGLITSCREGIYSHGVFNIIAAFIGIYLCLILSNLLADNTRIIKGIIGYIGKHTLYIMIYHIISFQLISIIQVKLFNYLPDQLSLHWQNVNLTSFWSVIAFCVGIVIPILINFLVKHIKSKTAAI